ncbi:hypothetical protein TTHERM_000414207 (macronuclear) [Tetrahymena thermophila SB210]|uniref:Uncharacterized protein n=1 Tax=Tetrahymena thermophila (strain SB210) TaxID=312017 RepID=W7XHB5_TETTS|nr:hypothetical protein TTHERM_000414207 [Tetrahymena thermophila SB210]EWS76598.1 hypothetical protein TTHERM_000414207 [Tetrahymena thermophila SB210]|eukprot:XP_012650884.1 hypothetical protein TTHERM_000414207 [Tetrahymena thermophila SB210]
MSNVFNVAKTQILISNKDAFQMKTYVTNSNITQFLLNNVLMIAAKMKQKIKKQNFVYPFRIVTTSKKLKISIIFKILHYQAFQIMDTQYKQIKFVNSTSMIKIQILFIINCQLKIHKQKQSQTALKILLMETLQGAKLYNKRLLLTFQQIKQNLNQALNKIYYIAYIKFLQSTTCQFCSIIKEDLQFMTTYNNRLFIEKKTNTTQYTLN